MSYWKSILATMVVMLILDALWLGFVAKGFYITQVGSILRLADNSIVPDIPAAIIVYLALLIGIMVFAVMPAHNTWHAVTLGALFGLLTYAVYDFTNQAVLANWNWTVALVDVCWGTVLGCLSAWAGFMFAPLT